MFRQAIVSIILYGGVVGVNNYAGKVIISARDVNGAFIAKMEAFMKCIA